MQFSRFHHTIRILFATCVLFCSLCAYAATIPNALYIVGTTQEDGKLNFSGEYKFVYDAENVLCCKNVPLYNATDATTSQMVISTIGNENWANGDIYTTRNTVVDLGVCTRYDLTIAFGSFDLPVGIYDFFLDFSGTLINMYLFRSEDRVPESLYLIGTLSEVGNIDVEGRAFERSGELFELNDIEVKSDGGSAGYIALCRSNYDAWNTLGYIPKTSITLSADEPMHFPMSFYKKKDDTSPLFSVPVGRYNMAADFTHLYPVLSIEKVSDSIETGIECVSVDTESRVEYYTLDGIRIDNPQRGIFIKHVTGSASLIRL